MTEESVKEGIVPDQTDPIAELKKIVNEQSAVIMKQNEAIKALTARMNETEKTAAAAPAAAPAAAQPPQKSPQEIAWKSMMKEFNIKEE